jgi:hypothetical protein
LLNLLQEVVKLDYKTVFGVLVAFAVLVFILLAAADIIQSTIESTEVNGEEIFRTQKYMAATVNIYSQGQKGFGVFDGGVDREELCDPLDSELFEKQELGFDLRWGDTTGDGTGGEANTEKTCHSPEPYMSSVMLNWLDTEHATGFRAETLEVGDR